MSSKIFKQNLYFKRFEYLCELHRTRVTQKVINEATG